MVRFRLYRYGESTISELIDGNADRRGDIITLFKNTFAASEGETAGDLIANLMTGRFNSVAPDDIMVSQAIDDGTLIGTVTCTRTNSTEDECTVLILS